MFENVVVGIRGEDDYGHGAIALARQLLSPHGAVAFVNVHVVTSRPAPDSGAEADAATHRYILERLTALAEESAMHAEAACIDARSVRRGLHEFASRRGADLLVVSASHNDELARMYIDDTYDVLEKAPCAVAVAPSGYASRAGDLHRIGVAYDGSPESGRAVDVARELAAAHRAVLSAFEAVKAPMYVHDPSDVDGEIDQRVAAAQTRIASLGGIEPEARFGDAVEELIRYAQGVDLLVFGSHKYTAFDRLLEGSTSQRVADRAASPLLVLAAGQQP